MSSSNQPQELNFYQPVNKTNPFNRAVVEKLKQGKWTPASEINLKKDMVQHSNQQEGEKVITAINLFDPKGNRSVLQDFVQKKSAADREEERKAAAYMKQFGSVNNIGTASSYSSYNGGLASTGFSTGYQTSQLYPVNQADNAGYLGTNYNYANATPNYSYYQAASPGYIPMQSPQVLPLMPPMTVASANSPYDFSCMCLECQRLEQMGLSTPMMVYSPLAPRRYNSPHMGCNCLDCQIQNRD